MSQVINQLKKILSDFFHSIYIWVCVNIFDTSEKEEPFIAFFVYNIRNRGSGDEFIITRSDDHELVRKFAHARGFSREPENIRVLEYMVFYYPDELVDGVSQCEIIVCDVDMNELGRYDNRRDLEQDFPESDNLVYAVKLVE